MLFSRLTRQCINQGGRLYGWHRHGQQIGNLQGLGHGRASRVGLPLLAGAVSQLQVPPQLPLGIHQTCH